MAILRRPSLLRIAWVLVLLIATLVTAVGARAVEPDEILKDPALEIRARGLSAELRCLVCQNQSIDDSNAPLARDLRVIVRERLSAGDTDAQVIAYVVARYGEFVLLRPRFGLHTLLLWLTPFVLLAVIALVLWRHVARSSKVAPSSPVVPAAQTALTDDEKARLEALIARGDGK